MNGWNSTQRKDAAALIEGAANELRDAQPDWTDDDHAIAVLADECFFRRHLMCIGTFEAIVTVNDHNRVLVHDIDANIDHDFPIMGVKALDEAVPATGRGSVEVFISPRFGFVLTTVSRDGETVALHSLSEAFTQERREEISELLLSHERVEAKRSAFADLLGKALKADAKVVAVRDHYRKEFGRFAEEIYAQTALSVVPREAVTSVRRKMADTGFYHVLDNDADLVMQVAQLSLACSLRIKKTDVARLLSWSDEKLDHLFERLAKVARKCRFPIAEKSKDGKTVVCFV